MNPRITLNGRTKLFPTSTIVCAVKDMYRQAPINVITVILSCFQEVEQWHTQWRFCQAGHRYKMLFRLTQRTYWESYSLTKGGRGLWLIRFHRMRLDFLLKQRPLFPSETRCSTFRHWGPSQKFPGQSSADRYGGPEATQRNKYINIIFQKQMNTFEIVTFISTYLCLCWAFMVEQKTTLQRWLDVYFCFIYLFVFFCNKMYLTITVAENAKKLLW